jgi:hypothetical protein
VLLSQVLKQNRRSPCKYWATPISLYGASAPIFRYLKFF